MRVLDAEFVKGFVRMANDGWEQGWHERNGGNLSYRIKTEEVESVKECFVPGEWVSLGISVPALAGEYFLVTGSGKFFRNIILDPEANICIVEVDGAGENYRIVWGLKNGGRPTSELPAHLKNLEVKKLCNENFRVVYHAHPANIIALTFVIPLSDEAFTKRIWEMITECVYVFPEGIGVLPWMVCGNGEIASKTSELMKKYNVVVWAHHGIFAAGEDFDLTFGLLHTVEKAAEILVKVISMGDKMLSTITKENIKEFAEAFKFSYNEDLLK